MRDQARAMPLTSLCSTSIPSFNAVLVLGVCVYVDISSKWSKIVDVEGRTISI